MTDEHPFLRPGAIALGAALAIFSVPGIFFPRFFARQFGLTVPDEPSAVAIRSVAIRDTVMGVGLVSAAMHGSRLAPWLMMRALCDGGDAIAVGVALARGAGSPRLGALGVLALGGAVYDTVLWRLALKRSDRA
jgi:hypothetical protein